MSTSIALIGMSGIGKSYWSAKLATDAGFVRASCDELIEEALADLLVDDAGKPISLGRWMGFPYEPHYAEREQQYLAMEERVTGEALQRAGSLPNGSSFVLDTTGSAIYLPETLWKEIKARCRVAYLEINPNAIQSMFELYRKSPVPVVWGNHFSQLGEERPEQALANCYQRLIKSRLQMYRDRADIILPYELHRDDALQASEFVARIS